MKPQNTEENKEQCLCPQCYLYTECNKGKGESFFCGETKSECAMDAKKLCICGRCPVYIKNSLEGGYLCINELK